MQGGGHQLLISYLLSPDTACQRVGALGIGNLATNPDLRVTLMESGAMEPLMSLGRSEDIEIEIQRFAVLAMANRIHSRKPPSSCRRGTLPFSSLCQMPQTKRCDNMQPMHW